ncbi:MAG: hypothetical protein HRU19_29835 [Pseudobacteriovorax sp.]|nr:hypothetical protein [Pseudobacteriovorax sp.]
MTFNIAKLENTSKPENRLVKRREEIENLKRILRSGGLLLSEAGKLLGTKAHSVLQLIGEHSLTKTKITGPDLAYFKDVGQLGKSAKKATFLPTKTLQVLVKLIETKEASDVYMDLWAINDEIYENQQKSQQLGRDCDKAAEAEPFGVEIKHEDTHSCNSESLEDISSEFPADCMPIEDISNIFFGGLEIRYLDEYLSQIDHPNGVYKKHYTDGPKIIEPYQILGLEAAARDFYLDLEIHKIDGKWALVSHPCFKDKVYIEKISLVILAQ